MTRAVRRAALIAIVVAICLVAGEGFAASVGARFTSSAPRVLAAQTDPNAPLAPAALAPAPGSITGRVSPLRDRRGLHPGLSPVPASQLAQARGLIRRVRAAAGNATLDYDRDLFGSSWTDNQSATWGKDGCSTRENVLRRDMRAVTFKPDGENCHVLTGVLRDPYTATTIQFSTQHPSEVQIDHVMALSYDWAQGASNWSTDKRKQIANDPLNLLAVDGPTNQAKGDSGPADWLPPNRRVHCAYAVRFAQVSVKYHLAVTAPDRRVMLMVCRPPR